MKANVTKLDRGELVNQMLIDAQDKLDRINGYKKEGKITDMKAEIDLLVNHLIKLKNIKNY